MDPPPTTEPAAAEPPAQIAHAANPTPPLAPNQSHSHPPYTEMITAAITALKEKDGSSSRAIAKYIAKAYTNLPSTHSALLTHHLKRLKNIGHLVMVKHSYKLPRSVPLSSTTTTAATANGNASSSGLKRGPGRPPKPKVLAQPNTAIGPESVLISLGLIDGPVPVPVVKRGPGRPPLVKSGLVGSELSGPVVGKKGPGRPSRPKSLSVLMGQDRPKRGPGRPPRTGAIVPAGAGRPRGRPKKDGSVMKATGRPRGRPPKNAVAAFVGGGALVAVDGGVLPGKRRGRPPNAGGGGGGVKKLRKLSGKPLGRPRKNASMAAIQGATTQHPLAYEDLKTKLEHFQARIKLAVSVVKPHLNNETSASALGALQELEELATMDMSAPLNVQVQVQEQILPS